MRIRTRYITVETDERLNERLAYASDHLRTTVTGYLRSAADDVGTAGTRLSAVFERAATRVNAVIAALTNKVAPPPVQERNREIA